jgi:hypothetical protein
VGIDMNDVANTLEQAGIAGFDRSFTQLLDTWAAKHTSSRSDENAHNER